ncbi:hypothetical protein Q7P37_001720 [Cladosporium fusiforme]
MTRMYSVADNSAWPSPNDLLSLSLSQSPQLTHRSALPPLLINSKHAAQTAPQHTTNAHSRLGHAADFAAAAHRQGALRQAGPAWQVDAEVVWVWVYEMMMVMMMGVDWGEL